MDYCYTTDEAKKSTNRAYKDERAWDRGCRSWHNGGFGGMALAQTFVQSPTNPDRWACVPYGNDESRLLA